MNFYSFISIAVEAEAKLEEIRILLGSYLTFEPFSAFKRLDQQRTGGLRHESIVEFLTDNQIQFTDDELNYMFRFFDQDQDGTIIYEEFKNCILPKLNDQVKNQILHHKGYDIPVGMLLPQEVERGIAEFFQQLQKNYQSFQQIGEKINLNQLDIYDNDNSITIKSLQNWLKSIQQQIHDQILERFILMINGNQQELQNLLEQIYQYEQKNQEQEVQEGEYEQNQEEELLEVGANQSNIPVPENTEQEVDEQPQQQEQQILIQEDNQDHDDADNNLLQLESIERDILSECQKIRRTLRSFSQQQSFQPIVLPILDKQLDDRTCQSIYYQTSNTIQSNRTYFQNSSYLQTPYEKDLIRINKEIQKEQDKCDQILSEINSYKNKQLHFSNYSKVSGNAQSINYSTPSKNNYKQKLQQMSGSKISRANKNQYRPAIFNTDFWNSSKGIKKF